MTSYELHLLGLAVEESRKQCLWLQTTPDGMVEVSRFNHAQRESLWELVGLNETGLSHLLGKLGVEVPERPSERQVNAAYLDAVPVADAAPCSWAVGRLRDIYAREPLTVLALLEGGAS